MVNVGSSGKSTSVGPGMDSNSRRKSGNATDLTRVFRSVVRQCGRKNSVKEMFEDKLLSIKMTTEHPKGRMNRYIKNGVTYGLNLPVLKELVVETPFLPKATPERSYYPVGLKEGHYLISLMAPVPNTAAQTPTNSAGPTSHATESAKAARADAGQHAIVPAKTPLTVRLEQAVGVKTI